LRAFAKISAAVVGFFSELASEDSKRATFLPFCDGATKKAELSSTRRKAAVVSERRITIVLFPSKKVDQKTVK
jgi:hypothetical protein